MPSSDDKAIFRGAYAHFLDGFPQTLQLWQMNSIINYILVGCSHLWALWLGYFDVIPKDSVPMGDNIRTYYLPKQYGYQKYGYLFLWFPELWLTSRKLLVEMTTVQIFLENRGITVLWTDRTKRHITPKKIELEVWGLPDQLFAAAVDSIFLYSP